MIDRDHDLSIVRQAKVLKLARSTVYYEPRPVSAEDLALMRRSMSCISIIPSRERVCCDRCCGGRAYTPVAATSRR
ncbi:hypothetical protein AB7M74_011630 [Bradyrhizobium japonicum]